VLRGAERTASRLRALETEGGACSESARSGTQPSLHQNLEITSKVRWTRRLKGRGWVPMGARQMGRGRGWGRGGGAMAHDGGEPRAGASILWNWIIITPLRFQ
jgi:hypothetical protein